MLCNLFRIIVRIATPNPASLKSSESKFQVPDPELFIRRFHTTFFLPSSLRPLHLSSALLRCHQVVIIVTDSLPPLPLLPLDWTHPRPLSCRMSFVLETECRSAAIHLCLPPSLLLLLLEHLLHVR